MGHVRLGFLPRTRKWNDVMELIDCGAGVEQLAKATLNAAEIGLGCAGHDLGVVESVFLLMQLPLAARQEDFVSALQACGLSVSSDLDLFEITGAFSDAIDQKLPNCQGRTDLSEMAEMAALQTIHEVVGGELRSLFDTNADDVQQAFAKLGTVKQFGRFLKGFFGCFVDKCLNYFLSKELPLHVGEGKRFRTLKNQRDFVQAMQTHCQEAAKIVERYSGEWLSKQNWEHDGKIPLKKAQDFTKHAMIKLIDELKLGAK